MTTSKLIRRGWYGAVVLLSLIGMVIVVRRTILLVPVLINGYDLPPVTSMFTQMVIIKKISSAC